MKAIMNRNYFLGALVHAQSVVTRGMTTPALSCILLKFCKDKLEVSARNLDTVTTKTVPAQVLLEGIITTSVHILCSVVRKIPDNTIVLETCDNDNKILLTTPTGRYHFSLSCLPKEDFQEQTRQDLLHKLVIPSRTLYRMLAKTSFAMSLDETRYYLNGIYLHLNSNNELCSVTTDGHRLALVKIPLQLDNFLTSGIILSRRTVSSVLALLLEIDLKEDIQMDLSDTQVNFIFPGTFLNSRLVSGSFPDYGRVIPNYNDKKMTVDASALIKSIERVSTILTEKVRLVKLSFRKKILTISSESLGIGSAIERLEVDYDNDPIEVGFNVSYLLEILNQVKDRRVEFLMSDSTTATIIRDVEDLDVLFLLMPMRF